jgi:ABC-type nitrate/sulfonate/bicarbonate transport system ATPase subunit
MPSSDRFVAERRERSDGQLRIDVRDLTKRFPRPDDPRETLTVLADVSLQVDDGTFVSLIGASGCGKTTLLRVMSGLVPYHEGTVRVNGQVVRGVPDSIGFVFQSPALLPWRTVRENLAFALKEQRLSKTEMEERVAENLDLTNLAPFASYYPHMLSGGMQQRAGLARALVGDPGVLFMDEPLSALDAFTRRRLQQDIGDIIARLNATTVLVTHDVDEAIFFSDRIMVMGTAPGTIREVIEVPLPRPRRHAELLGHPVATQVRDRVLGAVLDVT